eukprot:77660-Pyramimonas_sp.AAC.1
MPCYARLKYAIRGYEMIRHGTTCYALPCSPTPWHAMLGCAAFALSRSMSLLALGYAKKEGGYA